MIRRCDVTLTQRANGHWDARCDRHPYTVGNAPTVAEAIDVIETLHEGVTKADLYWAVITETVRRWLSKLTGGAR